MPTDGSGEREILIKAVRVNTLSKLTYGDTRQFLALIGDVFPGAESSDIPGVRKAKRKKKLWWCSARYRGIREDVLVRWTAVSHLLTVAHSWVCHYC